MALFVQAEYLVAQVADLPAAKNDEQARLLSEAADLLRRAIRADPHSGLLHRYLAEVQGLNGDFEGALVSVRRAVRLAPMDCRSHALEGFLRMDSDRPQTAAGPLQSSIRCGLPQPEQRQAWSALFELHRDQGEEAQAVATLDAWTKSLPEDLAARRTQAEYLWFIGRADGARDATVGALLAGSEDRRLAELLSLYFHGRPDEEANVLLAVVERFPLVHHRIRLVQCLRYSGRPDLALGQLRYVPRGEKVGKRSPADLKPWLYFEMHRRQEALEVLRGLAPSADGILLRARILAKEGDWATASQSLIAAGDTFAFAPGALINFSLDLLEEAGRYAEAMNLLASREAERLGDRAILIRAVRMLKKLGRDEEARVRLKEAIRGIEEGREEGLAREHSSRHHQIRAESESELISLLLLLQWIEDEVDTEASRAALDAVLRLRPSHPHALNARAYEAVRANRDLEEAQEWILQAVDQRPFSGAFVDTLAWLRFRQGEFEEARVLIERALHYAPGNSELLEHQRQIWERLAGEQNAGR